MTEKTELPTPQRIRRAREEGQVAHSKDFTQTVLVLALFGWILGNAEAIVRDLAEMILVPAGAIGMEFHLAVKIVAMQLLRAGLRLLAPVLAIVIGLGLIVELLQTGMLISFKALVPSGKKLDVVGNVKNIFSAKNLFEFLKSNLKIVLLSVVVYSVVRVSLRTIVTLPSGGLTAVAVGTAVLLKTMMLWVGLGYALLSIADFLWQRHQYIRQLKMTKDEVKQEFKEQEGDPHIKHRRKELHRELLEHGELQNVKRSSVVVTNPTHLAVALAYEKQITPLPLVIAMGEGDKANRIREIAQQHGIPVLQDIPLARALFGTGQLNQYIPSDLIEPVAQVLRVVRELKEQEISG